MIRIQLKPMRRTDYLPGAPFTDAEWAQLQRAFPGGVCDCGKPGVDQQPTSAWMTYQGANGNVVYGGQPIGQAPGGSGQGRADPAFADPAESSPGAAG